VGNKIIHLTLALIFLISFTSISNAGKETMIVASRLTLSPSIDGDIVTWADTFVNGAAMYNLTTGNITGLGHAGYSPVIQGDKVTWWDEEDIIVYNISTGKKIKIDNASTPAIYGDNLVYIKSKSVDGQPAYSQNGEYNSLYLYNLSTHKEVQVTPYEYATYSAASIYGNKIVWGRANQGNSSERSTNISIYDIPTKKVSDISRTGKAGGGKIHENIVVWVEQSNESRNIYMRDITKHKTRQVTFDGNSTSPDVYGDRIVWERDYWEGDNCSNGIYVYNLSTNETIRITSYVSEPAIYDDKIVYIGPSNTEDQQDDCIYLYNLSA
jgi:beta propeller repeat protein